MNKKDIVPVQFSSAAQKSQIDTKPKLACESNRKIRKYLFIMEWINIFCIPC